MAELKIVLSYAIFQPILIHTQTTSSLVGQTYYTFSMAELLTICYRMANQLQVHTYVECIMCRAKCLQYRLGSLKD